MPDEQTQAEETARIERDRQRILSAAERGTGAKLWLYTKLSGPGWLQSAITLGSGSLAGGLYLGILAGYDLLWLQPLAMILGVVMLSAIGYVALSTRERPFRAINRHINPVLGWGWAIATLMANLVWCMPQFSIGTAAVRQNLLADYLGPGMISETGGNLLVVAMFFLAATIVVWFYDSGGWGIKLFEGLLKAMVGLVVICFFGVVIKMGLSADGLDWGRIFAGYVPDLRLLYQPAASFNDALAATGEYAAFWKQAIVADQRDVMVTAAATAVGINMTFLLPYSMLARGWDRDFRGLAIFDVSTGLFVPFLLATSCVVISSATQFHAEPQPGLLPESGTGQAAQEAPANIVSGYNGLLDRRLQEELGKEEIQAMSDDEKAQARDNLPLPDKRMAAMLVRRDAFDLAHSLERLTGRTFSHYIFGIGVVGMALSTIIILMLINGFVVCEMLGLPSTGNPHRLGAVLAAVVGATGPFVWQGEAKFWLAVPTSVFGMVLLPIAYCTFFLMMNSRALLGERRPQGGKRVLWNILMGIAFLLAAFGSVWSIWNKAGWYGLGGLAAFILLVLVVHVLRPKDGSEETSAE